MLPQLVWSLSPPFNYLNAQSRIKWNGSSSPQPAVLEFSIKRVLFDFYKLTLTALWYYPVLMIISGIAMIIFDSRIIHSWIRKIRARFQRNQQEENIELGENTISNEAVPNTVEQSESKSIPLDIDNNETPLSRRNQQSQVQPDNNVEDSAPRVRSDEVKMPYSIRTGVVIFVLFLTSFIVIMVIRGVVHNSPTTYRFFANMYLAGNFSNVSSHAHSF
jgi:hypothetical protein